MLVERVGTPASLWLMPCGTSRRPLSSTSVLLEAMPRSETLALSPRAVAPRVAVSLPGSPVTCGMAVIRSEGWEASRTSIAPASITVTGRTFSTSMRLMLEPVTVNASSLTVSSPARGGVGAVWAPANGARARASARGRRRVRTVRFMVWERYEKTNGMDAWARRR